MKSIRLAAVYTASLLSLHLAAVAEPVGARLPADTHSAFWIDDIAAAKKSLESNGFYRLATSEQYGVTGGEGSVDDVLRRLPFSPVDPAYGMWRFLVPLAGDRIKGGMTAATSVFNFQPQEIVDTFSGSLALYSTMFDLTNQNGFEIVEWDVILAADFPPEDKEKVDRFLQSALSRVPKGARRKQVTYYGHDINHLEYFLDEQAALPGDRNRAEPDVVQEIPVVVEYGFVDNVLLLAEGRGEPLKKAVRAMSPDGAEYRLNQNKAFREESANLPEATQIRVFFDLPHHLNELRDWPSRDQTRRMSDALGLNNAGPLLAGLVVNEKTVDLTLSMTTKSSPTGAFAVIGNSPENELKGLELIPADALIASSLSIDFGLLYDQYRAALLLINPQAQRVADIALNAVQQTSGVDMQRDILDYAKGEMINYARPDAELEYAAGFYFPLKGGADARKAFDSLMRGLNSEQTKLIDLTESDYQGHTVWETSPQQTSAGLGAHVSAAGEGMALANSGAELREMLRRVDNGGDSSILDNENFTDFLRRVPKDNLRGFVYETPEAVAETTAAGLQRSGVQGTKEELERAVRQYLDDYSWTLYADGNSFKLEMKLNSATQ